jgi:hypothetical protein
MFGIPLPWLLLGLSVALFGTYRGGYHFGWADRDAEMQIAIAKKNEEAREVERNMTSKVIAQTAKLQEANDALNQKTTALDRAIRAGKLRLPASSCVQASTGSTAAPADRNDEASESERQTLAAIAAIVAEGDAAILQLNACISSYNEVRSLVNGQQ